MTGEIQNNLSWTRAHILGKTSFPASNPNSATSKCASEGRVMVAMSQRRGDSERLNGPDAVGHFARDVNTPPRLKVMRRALFPRSRFGLVVHTCVDTNDCPCVVYSGAVRTEIAATRSGSFAVRVPWPQFLQSHTEPPWKSHASAATRASSSSRVESCVPKATICSGQLSQVTINTGPSS